MSIMDRTEQQFLKALDDKLWKAADKLRANLDAANYKHVVLGLIPFKQLVASIGHGVSFGVIHYHLAVLFLNALCFNVC